MSGKIVPSELIERRCKKIFKECRQFKSIHQLQAVFSVNGLKGRESYLEQRDITIDSIDQTFFSLCEWGFYEHSPVILIFIRRLFPTSRDEDGQLYDELEKLYIDLDIFIYQNYPQHYLPFSSLGIASEVVADIVNALLKCPCMRSKEYRKEIWHRLHEDKVSYFEKDEDVADVFAFIWSCSSINDIQQLVHTIHAYEGDSQAWKSLHFIWLKKTKELAYPQLRILEEIIERTNLPEEVWRKAYKRSHSNEEEAPLLGASLFASLEDLGWQSTTNSGVQPALEFAERLVLYAEEHQQSKMVREFRNWIDERANALRIPPGNLITLRHTIQKQNRSTGRNFYLLVSLEPNDVSNKFHMKAWLFNSENEVVDNQFYLHIDGELSPTEHLLLSEIPLAFGNLLKRCEEWLEREWESTQRKRDLQIEFLLPCSLLNYPVEQWVYTFDLMPDELGIQYQVVVRSYDRYMKTFAQRNWKNKWLDLRAIIDEARVPNADTRTIWICEEEQYQDPHAMKSALLRHCTLCLALTFASSINLLKSPNCFDAILSAGIPVVIWPREPLLGIKDFFHDTLSWKIVDTLPNLVQEQRREAIEAVIQGNTNHRGRHLALLWDDPRRLPPVAEDEVPSYSGPE